MQHGTANQSGILPCAGNISHFSERIMKIHRRITFSGIQNIKAMRAGAGSSLEGFAVPISIPL